MITLPISSLVFDYGFYPRLHIDSQNVNYLVEAIKANASLPPPVIDAASKKVIDGFHRLTAFKRVYGESHELDLIDREYPDEAAMFADAMRLNATHGTSLNRADRTHCSLLGEKLGMTLDTIASALSMTPVKIGELRTGRVAEMKLGRLSPYIQNGHENVPVALKRSLKHLAGTELTEQQLSANRKAGGMPQSFFVAQLLMFIDNRVIDTGDEKLLKLLKRLRIALDGLEMLETVE